MKLTNVLFRWKKALPKGNIWRGKYRLVKKVTPLHMANKRAEYELEERNMFFLRNPYLTADQASFSVMDNANPEMKEKEWKKHRLLGDRFGFLKVADKWE